MSKCTNQLNQGVVISMFDLEEHKYRIYQADQQKIFLFPMVNKMISPLSRVSLHLSPAPPK